jgi:pyrimidine-nucleoside phosphorylase
MLPNRVIAEKRDGRELDPEVLRGFLLGYLDGDVEEYQMAAMLMAVVFRGLGSAELDVLLEVMLRSGDVLEWPGASGPVVDKHSTGGVGDKISLVLAPLAAEMGLVVPMISGRGLGHTTGTLDKLEAIPGFRTDLPLPEFRRVVSALGVGMIGQTPEIAPLDRRLYALRSATATVPAIPLIAASILSKKLAEGLEGLVLDVKVGDGAFLPGVEEARDLALTMVELGAQRGIRTAALLTAMDRPLGRAIGNALETAEAIECLRGEGPPDLEELVIVELVEMMVTGGLCADDATSRDAAAELGRSLLSSGVALDRFTRLVEAQGGNPEVVDRAGLLPTAPVVVPVLAAEAGVVGSVATRRLGHLVVEMGGGRRALLDPIDLSVGIMLKSRPGERVEAGQVLAEVHAATADVGEWAASVVSGAMPVEPGGVAPPGLPLVVERVASSGV